MHAFTTAATRFAIVGAYPLAAGQARVFEAPARGREDPLDSFRRGRLAARIGNSKIATPPAAVATSICCWRPAPPG